MPHSREVDGHHLSRQLPIRHRLRRFLHKDIVAQNCGTHWTIRECLPRESVRPQRRMRKADFQQDGDNE
ncbi:hypothetical protein T4B_15030 [Trichinella pseudospiralis]|uniref:Uncharacterized protein n=1 Tax=Trichinella pseudospiralis TaxID=6337 RepID=A0A0V1IUI0_TRIPS|nr:hypothetical protein T4B_15030 [Trichinella pseudospiralis]KRZ26205.1 hypothetical protein T4C_1323 [Trichinella pseudospiralis]